MMIMIALESQHLHQVDSQAYDLRLSPAAAIDGGNPVTVDLIFILVPIFVYVLVLIFAVIFVSKLFFALSIIFVLSS